VERVTADAAGEYLQRAGVVPGEATTEARTLGGGVSNTVVEVSWDGGCLVVKQPLANLAVEDDWPADVERVHNEAAAARAYADVIDREGLSGACVPSVAYEDREEHVIALKCAPPDARTWKANLLDGQVEPEVARTVGRLLGAVHRSAAGDGALRERFASKRPFDQLRIDPYHRTTARRHPDVADEIRAELDRIAGVERTLVHGDYSPKNVLVEPERDRVWILDFEVAHWGDPAFDVAFMCNHLFIKSVYNRGRHDAYVEAAFAFRDAYRERVDWPFEAATVRELGVLMLARVDGKSPVQYVTREAVTDALRRIAKRALTEDVDDIDAFAALTDEEVAAL